jgi:hypothetical protein
MRGGEGIYPGGPFRGEESGRGGRYGAYGGRGGS